LPIKIMYTSNLELKNGGEMSSPGLSKGGPTAQGGKKNSNGK